MDGRLSQEGGPVAGVAAAIPMPADAHPRVSTPAPWTPTPVRQLQAGWMWAPSALDHARVSRLSRLWFDRPGRYLRVWSGGRGGVRVDAVGHRACPGVAVSSRSKNCCRQYEVADILPLTPLQQGTPFSCKDHAPQHRAGQ